MRKRLFIAALLLGTFVFIARSYGKDDGKPKPYGVLPTPQQLKWQQMEYYMFAHFGPNTFTDVEWGDGKENPNVFKPSALDCRQWAATAKAAGMKGIIITAKHHDGFCLWPSKYSKHTVRESRWMDGKGDVLKELSEACREYGIEFGVYVSPWDRNHPAYGTDEYNEVFVNTLNEVLSGYGKVFEQWLDGANGDAAKGQVNQKYNWDLFHQTIYNNQPDIVIFSDIGPGCRWMGNERGVASETNWSRLDIEGFEPGLGAPSNDTLQRGNIFGKRWVPAETDVSIRPGWFYSEATDTKVKDAAKLMDIYYTSVGRNSNLLLNVPPNREGRIHPVDSLRLIEFRQAREAAFANNLLRGAKLKANNTRKGGYSANNLTDGKYNTYWATDNNITSSYVDIELAKETTFDCLLIQEYIPLGQRVESFSLERWDESASSWKTIAEGTTIGYKRILRFDQTKANKLRLKIKALACPTINNVELYKTAD